MPDCAYINRILNMHRVLNMPKFRIRQGSQYANIKHRSEYARICFDGVLNVCIWFLNTPGI